MHKRTSETGFSATFLSLGLIVLVAGAVSGCDGVASPDESVARPQPKPTVAAAPSDEDTNAGSRNGPSGGRRSTLGKALDFAERTVDDAEQKSRDLADEYDHIND